MITFIVPVKNGLDYTRDFIESVRTTNPDTGIEWVIVDSGSTDGTPQYVESLGGRVVPFHREPFNYCAAVNAGAEHASGGLWIIANNDILFRSNGDLARLERTFAEWPLLGVASPGRPEGEAALEFVEAGVNGACWAVRPEAFRAWGGMPEGMSGYGYDEAFTAFGCWEHGYALSWLTGWDVFHHGSVTFGPLAGNVTPALRRNLSRLLRARGAEDLDRGSPVSIMKALTAREKAGAPARLWLPHSLQGRPDWQHRQGYVNVRPMPGASEEALPVVMGDPATMEQRQWLPWLANELLRNPHSVRVGGSGWQALRPDEALPEGVAVAPGREGPEAPVLMPPLPEKRPTLRQRVSAWVHDFRNREATLPPEW